MNKLHIYFTRSQCFTVAQAEQHLKGKVSTWNWEVLLDHITVPELAYHIIGFLESEGELHLITDGGIIQVSQSMNNPLFSK